MRRSNTFFLALAFIQGIATAQCFAQYPVSNYVFAMPPHWVLLSNKAVSNDHLLFRRFSVAAHKEQFDHARATGSKVEFIGKAGTLYNSMIFNCARDKRKPDHVTFHMPNELEPVSFGREDWVSKLAVRILADSTSIKFDGEYIKGDLFVDSDGSGELKDFLKLLNASSLTVEFGKDNDRFNLFVADKIGSAELAEFTKAAIPPLLNQKPASVKFMSTAKMLDVCSSYKRTGKF